MTLSFQGERYTLVITQTRSTYKPKSDVAYIESMEFPVVWCWCSSVVLVFERGTFIFILHHKITRTSLFNYDENSNKPTGTLKSFTHTNLALTYEPRFFMYPHFFKTLKQHNYHGKQIQEDFKIGEMERTCRE